MRQRAGAAHLDHGVRALRERQHLREIGPRLGGAGGVRGCRIARWSMMKRVSGWRSMSAAPASRLPQHSMLTGKVVTGGCARDAVEAGIVRVAVRSRRRDHDANADRARRLLPVGDDVGHRRIVRVDRLDDREAPGCASLHFHRIARVVAVHGKGRDEDRAVDADLVHRRDHLVAGDVGGQFGTRVPGPLRRVRFVGVDLGIDDRHRASSLVGGRNPVGCGTMPVSFALAPQNHFR